VTEILLTIGVGFAALMAFVIAGVMVLNWLDR
jgi:hypothetical protein